MEDDLNLSFTMVFLLKMWISTSAEENIGEYVFLKLLSHARI